MHYLWEQNHNWSHNEGTLNYKIISQDINRWKEETSS